MYLGSQLVSTDAAGNMIGGPFSYNFAVPIAPGWVVSATATNTGTGRTSEFSNAIGTATISGTIWEDVDGDSQLGDFVGRDGVTVRLYRDAAGGGAGAPDATDTLVGTVVTSGGGLYAFNNLADGTYWAIVDSRTFTRPVAQLASGAAGQDDIWAEQTYGVTGAMNGASSFLAAAGALFGGRNAAISDNAFSGANINAPEHVTRVAIAGANAAALDSAFSFSAVVNVRGDTTDDDATAGALRVQQGSLRQFILNANEITGVQTSNFSIGGGGAQTIAPTAGFASITDAAVLDATTQEGFAGTPLIELDGTGAGGATGLTLSSNGSTVRGFVINRFGNGIRISGDNNLVAGNWIGLDATGSLDRGNTTDGIILVTGAADNTIGGTGANDRNVISGNDDDGISIDGASGTIVIGNYIGTNAQGTAAVGNSGDGVAIQLDGGVTPSTNTTVGGTSTAERNVISGNAANSAQGLANVRIRGAGTTGSVLVGNYIGTDYTGAVALANPRDGIVIDEGALNNTIGGAVSGAGNVISGSTNNGIRVQGTYSYAAGDVLATIYGNRIGTNAAGTAALANGQSGIFVDGSSGTAVTAPQRIAIGGTGANQGNTIAFNTQDGVAVTVNASRVTIVGNSIYSNGSAAGDLGIDLAANGVTNNDGTGPYDGDTGPNTLQNFPAFSAVTTDGTTLTVSGRLDSIASTTYTIHFYASTAIDASSHGEGQRYLGSTTVLTNASGTVLFNSVPISAVVAPGEWVSMTATDPSGNTSEFSVSVAANTPPVNTVPGAQSIPEDTTQAIAGISVGDAETNVNSLQLAVSNGILNVAAAGGAGVAGNGSVSVVITGTQAAINATVASLTYRGSLNYTGPDTLTVTATDAGSLTDVDTVAITVNPVDDAPVNSVPGAQSTNEDTALVFSAGNGNLVSISDLDAGAASVQVQLTVANGTLTLSGTAGLTLVAGGSGTATMTYTGTIASWNAAMAGMSYAPTANYNGAATLTIVTNDLGNSGSGGPLTDTDVVNITVNPVNDAPVALNDGYTVAEDSTLTVGWWDTDWSRRQQITFNNTNVGGFAPAETLSSFPVLLVLNSTNVDYSLTQDDGGDLRFFDGDGAPLAYEIERWDETGNSYVWVKVPQIDIGATDWITMYYGNASVADGEDSSAVWAGTGYRSVYHLDDVGPTVQDATSTNYDGTATNGATGGQTGQIGTAYGFDAADDYINLGDDRSFIDGASAATFSAWVRPNNNDGVNPNIILSASINSGGAPSGTSRMAIELDPFGDIKFIVRSNDSADTTVFTTGTPVTALTWHYITGVVDVVTNEVTVYVDGVARPITAGPYTLPGTAFPNSSSGSASIGSSDEGAGPYFDGRIDEARIATAARTPGWIQAEYRAMSNQAGTEFVAFGTPQGAPALGGVLNNDADAEGDRLSSAVVTNVSNGTLTLNSDGTFVYTPDPNFFGTDTFTYWANDGTNNSNVATVTITVNPVNDAPTATNLSAAETYIEDTALNLTDIVVSDVDSANVTVTLTLSDVAAGALNTATAGAVTSTFVGGVWTAAGALADVNTLLAGLTFTPALNYNANFTIATSVSDGVAAPLSGTKTMTGTPVNDAPTATNLSAAETYIEDTALNLTDIVVSDVDSANVTVTLTLSDVAAGALNTATAGAVTSTFVGGVWTAAGALADVNTLLAGLTFTPALNYNANFTIATSVSDGVAAPLSGTKTMTGTPVNDAPTATNLSAAETYIEDTALNLTDIVVSDVDSANVTVTLTLSDVAAGALNTATAGAVTSTFVGGVWTAAGALADVNTLLAGLTFTPALNYNANFTIATSVSDGVAAPLSGTKTMTGTPVNDAPTATNLSAAETYIEDTALNLTDIVVSDVDSANVTVTLTLSDVAAGALNTATAGAVTSTFVGGVWTAAGALADVNTLLAGLTFTPALNYNANFTIATSVSDGVAAPLSGTKTMTGTPVNDAPTATNLSAAETYIEDTALNLTDIVVSDVDSANVTVTLTLSDVAAGALNTATAGAVTSTFVGGVWTAAGALADVNTLLAGLTFTPALNYNANFTIATSVSDGVAAPLSGTKTMTGTPVNDAPTATNLSAAETYIEDTALNLTDIVVSDVDSANVTVTLTLSDVAAGALNTATAGAVTSTFVGGVWTAAGALADVNTLLAGLTFTPALNYNANFTIATSLSDGVAAPLSGTKTMTGTPVNDAPTATNLSAAETYIEDTALNLTDIVVSDVDSANVTVTLTLSDVAAGALNTATAGAVTSTFVGGVWTAAGALADVNTLLAGLTFTPALNYNANFTIATSVSDGVAAPLSGTKTMTGTPVNDAPTATNLSAAETYIEDTALNLTDIVVSDVDSANVTVTLTLSDVAAGALNTATAGAVTSTFVGGVWTAAGALADVNTLLAGLTFTPALNYNANFTIATSVSDGVAAPLSGTKTMTGTPVNDAPTATNLSAAETYIEDTALNLTDIVVSDVDSANVTVTLTLSDVAAGALNTATAGAVTSTFVGGVWTAAGALADVNTLLAGLTFTPALNYNANFTIATSVSDGVAAPLSGTKTMTGTPVNDAPTATNLSAAETYIEDTALNLTDIVVSDVDSANVTVTLTLSDVAAGALNTATAGAVTSTFVGGVWTAAGALADVNTLLAGLTFTPALNYNANFTIATSVSDGVAAPLSGTKTMTGTPVNDAPTATNLSAAETYIEDTALNLTDIVVSDVDSANVTVTLTLSDVAAGALNTATAGAVTSTFVGGVWTAAGALADVNTLLAGLTFTPALNYNANFTIATSVSDGVAAPLSGTKTMTGTPVNDAPTASGLANVTVNEDAADTVVNLFAAFADVEDADPALVYTVVGNTNAALFTSTAVNGAAGTLTLDYAPNAFGTADITVRATDTGGAFVESTFTVTVNPVNDAPTRSAGTVTNLTVAEDAATTSLGLGALAYSPGPTNESAQTLTYTVTAVPAAALGTILLADGTTVVSASTSYTLTELRGMQFRAAADANGGPATFSWTVTDSGGGTDTLAESLSITVSAVNDAPAMVDNAFSITNGATLSLSPGNLSAVDADNAVGTLAFTVAGVTNGRFELAAAPGVAITSFTQQQILDGEVVFVHDGSGNAPAFTILVSDGSASDGPYLGNVVFGRGGSGGGVIISPPAGGGGGSGGDGTLATISPPKTPPASQPEAADVAGPAAQEFLRAPTSAASGDGDAGPIDTSATPPRQATGAELQKIAIAVTELPSVRAEAETVTLHPASQDVRVEPLVAEMRVLPVRGEPDAKDEERARVEVVFNSIKITGLAMSVGAVWWAARAAGLIASLLASSPAWRHVDPLPVLGRDDEDEDEYDAAEEDKDRKDEEHRAAWVLEER